jgi:hypothetical protein
MEEDQSASRFFLLLALGHQPIEVKRGKLPMKLKLTEGLKCRQGAYNIIGDFIFRMIMLRYM